MNLSVFVYKTFEIASFLSSCRLLFENVRINENYEIPVTLSNPSTPMMCWLFKIDLSLIHFAATFRALDAEILISAASAGVSVMPQDLNRRR